MSRRRAARLRCAALAVCACLPLLAACAEGGHVAHAGTREDPWVVGMSQCTLNEPWRVQMNKDIAEAAAAHDNVEVLFKDAQDKNSTQQAQVEELVAQGIDVLIISPRETGPLDRVVQETHRAGIKVIVLDRRVGVEDYDVFIGADNLEIGRAAGRWAAHALGGSGTIVMLKGNMASSPGRLRHRGFLAGLDLEAHPKLVIGYQAETDWKEAVARREMESALVTLARIDLVFGHNDPAAHGAFLAAKDAGREDEMKFLGIDALPHEGVEYVREGILDATFLYPTGGAEAIDVAVRLLRGEEVGKVVRLATRVYDAASVEDGGREIR